MAHIMVPCPRCGARKYVNASTSKAATEQREWILANRPLCNDCVADDAYAAAAARARELELLPLQGSETQIKLAERVRLPVMVNLMMRAERPLSMHSAPTAEQLDEHAQRQDALTWLSGCTDAVWWVEHRTDTDAQLLIAGLEQMEFAQRPANNQALIDAVETEALIMPKKKAMGTATLRLHNGLEVIAPGNLPSLRNALQGLGFEWAHKARRWILVGAGTPIAVAAGQALLDLGFSVRVLDNDVRMRIKSQQQ